MSSNTEYPDLTTFKALSFDVYGTLIDWESGMLSTLSLITSQLSRTHAYNTTPPSAALERLDAILNEIEHAQPSVPYNEILTEGLTKLGAELQVPIPDSVAEPFGNTPGTWTPFGDTVAGLQKLGKHYKLIVLSNVDNANIRATVEKQLSPAAFDAVYTAQDIGSYKPSLKNFEYLFAHAREELGVDKEKGELLHVAQSLRADHVPAKEIGLRSVWISRGGDEEGKFGVGGDLGKLRDKTAFEWRFDTIGDFANEVEKQFAAKKGGS